MSQPSAIEFLDRNFMRRAPMTQPETDRFVRDHYKRTEEIVSSVGLAPN